MVFLARLCGHRDSLWAQLMCDLNLERSTWELIHVLYSDRINSDNMDNWDMETAIPLFTVSRSGGVVSGLPGVYACHCGCLPVCMQPSVKSDRKLAEDVFTKDSSIRQSQVQYVCA